MLTLTAKCKVKVDKCDDFLKLAKELVEETKKEEGCISYTLLQDVNDSGIITFLEQWKDEEALVFHGKTEHFKSIVPQLSNMQVEETKVNIYKCV
jgi:quinol monooxygenase YgiN